MNPIPIKEATQKLPDLIDAALRGEEVTITKNNSVVKLIPAQTKKPRQPGSAKGQVWMSDDFEEPLEEFAEYR